MNPTETNISKAGNFAKANNVDTRTLSRPGNIDTYGNAYGYGADAFSCTREPKLRLYREMADNDAVVSTIIINIETWLKRVAWRVEPAIANDDKALEWARFVEGALFDDMSSSWEDVFSDILEMIYMGHAVLEQVYKLRLGPNQSDSTKKSKYDDGLVGWRKLVPVSPLSIEMWRRDAEGGIQGLTQRDPVNNRIIELPISKLLLFRTKSNGNDPRGLSMLRGAVQSWERLKRIQYIEAVGIERDLSGYPVMEVPLELFDDENNPMLAEMSKIVTNVRRDNLEGAVIPAAIGSDGVPTGYKFSLMNSGGSRAINIDQTIRRYEIRMAASALVDFIFLGTDNTGSFSMHSSKTAAFAVALTSILDSIAGIFNRFAIPSLMRLNGVPPKYDPYIVHGDLAPPPFEQIAQYVSVLAQANMLTPDKRIERKLREFASLPEMDDEEMNAENVSGLPPELLAQLPDDVKSKFNPTPDGASPAALTPAQMTAIMQIVTAAAAGTMPRASALAMLRIGFNLGDEAAQSMLAGIGGG
jgi:hypothetical protein